MQFSPTPGSPSKSIGTGFLQHHQSPSGSKSDTSTPSSTSYHRSPSPDTELGAHLRHTLVGHIGSPSDFQYHPVSADEFWSLWSTPDLWSHIESRGFTYNSSARTLHVKPMSVGLHNVGWLWCSTGLDTMHDDGFIATKDLAQKARGVKKLLGLIMQVENKSFAGFDETTPWGNMHRTPDWAIYRISESCVTDKPLLVMEIGVSQQLTRSPKSKSPKETLQERAEGWLLSTMGITKAVLLIDLSKMQPVSDQSTVLGAGHPAGCINVTVQVWRINPDTALPRIDETHSFVVCADSEAWDDAEVPEDFPKGITFRAEDVYGAAAEEGKTFVLPLSWLRTAIVNTWALHVDDAEARKVVNRARVSDITRGGV